MGKHWLLPCALVAAGLWLWHDKPGTGPEAAPPSASVADAAGEAASAPVSSRRIGRDDLPPAGTASLFDLHVARLGQLPFPFDQLLDSFKPLDRWNQGSIRLLIPDGRSLARGHTDYRQPRVLAAVQLDPLQSEGLEPIYSGRVFLGYVEAIDALEIIAYNPAAGRFEFQVVENYCAGCKPRILYPRRAICMACHQFGTPIFAVRPWSETNANPAIAKRIADARGVPWTEASKTGYHGAQLSTQIVMPETFDQLVEQASLVDLAQRSWLDGCGETGLHCRRQLLAQSIGLLLTPGDYDPEAPAAHQLRELQARHWPAPGIPLSDHRLADRVPDTPSPPARWLTTLKRQWQRLLKNAPESQDSTARLAAFRQLPRLPEKQDPLRLRPPRRHLSHADLDGTQALAQMFIPADRSVLLEWSQNRPEDIIDLIQQGEIDQHLGPEPFQRLPILGALASALHQSPPAYCCTQAVPPPPEAEHAQALSIRPGSPLEAFSRYCFACHRGNPAPALNFMDGRDEDAVLAQIRQHPRMLEMLGGDNGAIGPRMPPARSQQRRALDRALAQQSDALKRMRDTVAADR